MSLEEVTEKLRAAGTAPATTGRPGTAFALESDERARGGHDAFLVLLDNATRPLSNVEQIIQTTACLLGEYLGADRCGYCTFEPDEETLEIRANYTRPGAPSIVGRYSLSQFGAEAVRLFKANLPYVVDDVESDIDDRASYRDLEIYSHLDIRSHLSVPLHKGGRLVAAIGVHQRNARRWLPEETRFVQLVANRCWEAVERAHVSRELETGERRLRLSQKAGRIGSFEWSLKDGRISWSAGQEALYGLAEGEFEGHVDDWSRRLAAEDAHRVFHDIASCLAQGNAELAFEFRAALPDGRLRWLRVQAQFFYDAKGAPELIIGTTIDIEAQMEAEAHLKQQWHAFGHCPLQYARPHLYLRSPMPLHLCKPSLAYPLADNARSRTRQELL